MILRCRPDALVLEAYGWPASLTDEDVLERLRALLAMTAEHGCTEAEAMTAAAKAAKIMAEARHADAR